MRILVTNDDGINAHGLKICEEIARKISDDVWVVAPEHDQSGVSHSLSLNDPLRLRQIGERAADLGADVEPFGVDTVVVGDQDAHYFFSIFLMPPM